MSKQYLYRISILNKQSSHPLEAIAYYCGEPQYDLLNSKEYQSTTEDKVVWNNIITPEKLSEKYIHLPEYLKFRSKKIELISNARNILWKNVYVREKRADSQYARLFELAVPSFLSQEIAVNLLENFCEKLVAEGMIIDGSLHRHHSTTNTSIFEKLKLIATSENKNEDSQQDYTAYLMCTLRDYNSGEFINKNRDWNNLNKMREWREEWVNILSKTIQNADVDEAQRNIWLKKFSVYKNIETNKPTI